MGSEILSHLTGITSLAFVLIALLVVFVGFPAEAVWAYFDQKKLPEQPKLMLQKEMCKPVSAEQPSIKGENEVVQQLRRRDHRISPIGITVAFLVMLTGGGILYWNY